MSPKDIVLYRRWALAMMEFEGYWEGSVSFRNNNPLNTKDPDDQGIVNHDERGHAIFDTFQNGWRSGIKNLVNARTGKSEVYKPENSLLEFYQKYSKANSTEYASFVAQRLRATIDTKLKDLNA